MALRQDRWQTTLATPLDEWIAAPRDGSVDVQRDRALVERCQAGDRRAFDEFYTHYHRRLHRFCIQRLGDSHDSEDVVQETFVRAWRALPTFAGERRFYPWLTVIAANLCVDTLRRRSRQTPVEASRLQAEDPGTYETEDAILQDVDVKTMMAAFGQLSERYQRVLKLREEAEWTYRQIADHEGVGVTAVETLLWRARQALKREFMMLDGQHGRLGSFIGVLLPVRTVIHMVKAVHQVAGAVVNGVRAFGSGPWGGLGASGSWGVFGPTAAVVAAVAVGVGGALAVPSASLANPAVSPPTPALSVPSSPLTSAVAPASTAFSAVPITPVSALASALASALTPVLASASPATGSVTLPSPTAGGPGSPTVPAVGGLAGGVNGTLPPTAATGASPVVAIVGGTVNGLAATVSGTVAALGSTVGTAVSSLNGITSPAGLGITVQDVLQGVGNTVQTAGQGLTNTVAGTVNGLTGLLGLPSVAAGTSTASGPRPNPGS